MGLEGPRTVLLLPFWLRALRFDPIVVGIFRNPLEVADSLAARDRMPKRQALRLWETYNRALLANARGLPAFIAAYEDLVGDCVAVALRAEQVLGAQGLTTHQPGDREYLRSCVDADLRHNLHSASGTHADGDMTEAQHELLRTLRESAASTRPSESSRTASSRTSRAFDQAEVETLVALRDACEAELLYVP